MKVYLDAGAYNGDTLDCERLFRFKADYKIAFEPNPKFYTYLHTMDINELHKTAVWIKDEVREFAVDQTDTPMGSTLMESKVKIWNNHPHVEMKCIDFSDFIKDAYQRLEISELIVKMDIEGAEFPVLDHLIKTGADELITKLYVEMHPNKVRDYTTQDKKYLLSRLNCRYEEWH